MRARNLVLMSSCVALFAALGSAEPRNVDAQSAGTAIAVIVAAKFGPSDISLALVKRMFQGEPTEFGGARALPFNFAPDHPLRREFDRAVLGMPPAQVGAYWIDRRIRGQGLPPKVLPSPQIMRAVIAKLPGAIGYVTADQLDATVIALTVDGKSIKAHDYPLRLR